MLGSCPFLFSYKSISSLGITLIGGTFGRKFFLIEAFFLVRKPRSLFLVWRSTCFSIHLVPQSDPVRRSLSRAVFKNCVGFLASVFAITVTYLVLSPCSCVGKRLWSEQCYLSWRDYFQARSSITSCISAPWWNLLIRDITKIRNGCERSLRGLAELRDTISYFIYILGLNLCLSNLRHPCMIAVLGLPILH